MFWCFHCYAVNDHPSGPCDVCGEEVAAPAGLSLVSALTWALRHPDGDRALVAARVLGRLRATESVPALREAAEAGRDVYLRAEAVRSLVTIEGPGPLRQWLDGLGRTGPVTVRTVAREALESAAVQDAVAAPEAGGTDSSSFSQPPSR